jgi:hypothetical protein
MEKFKWGVFAAVVALVTAMTFHPEWTHAQYTPPSGGGSSGCSSLGGDVTGTCAANTVAKLQNRALAATAPSDTNTICWAAAGSTWKPCTAAAATANQNIRTIGYHFDGGGSALSGTITYCAAVPSAGTISGWHIDADQSGSATFGVRKVAFASYTGTAGFSGYTDVTGGGTAPVLSSAVTATSSSLTSWVTTVTAGQEYCFQLSSPATVTWVNVVLQFTAN